MRHAEEGIGQRIEQFRSYALVRGAGWIRFILLLLTVVLLYAAGPEARAGGPRFVSGTGIAVQPGQAEGWATTRLTYFTDPGPLAGSVSHNQADTMVAAAAAVWNVPTSSLSLVQAGQLAEHVSSSNSYFDGRNFVFPSDVQVSNEQAIPVAVLYDTDGSLTDLLLGDGASEPDECRGNAVTQSVDDIQTDGHLHHAIVVLNGRCVGGTPEQLTQMQYGLARAFGRVLGLAWSQNNDNVFTVVTTVTADQVTYWPLMHPLDVFCAEYSYQCMINPFSLRPDDISALATLYPVLAGNVPAGKQASDTDAADLYTLANFPTGQGMAGLNFTATRQHYGVTDHFQLVSGVTGAYYQQSLSSPITGAAAVNSGNETPIYEGLGFMRVVQVEGLSNVILRAEPINPLYTGEYAIAPYVHTPVSPSGSAQGWTDYSQPPVPDLPLGNQTTAWDAASSCHPGSDGVEAAPAAVDPSGWQSGQLCGWGHNSWWSATVRAGRSWTLEVTATDETGTATTSKAQTVLGVWNATDAPGTLPTLASGAVPFNSLALGVTQIQMGETSQDTPVRIAVGDAYGVGRPDFTYTARVLYADAVAPAAVGAGGGLITITGMGFRTGNVVSVNGAPVTVKTWSATTIVALAPAAASVGVRSGTKVDITVSDPRTGGATTISHALRYTSAPDLLQLVSAPSGIKTGVAAPVPFAVRVLASDGVTPLPRATVQFAVHAGAAKLTLCEGAPACEATTNDQGIAQTTVAGVTPGQVTLGAAETSGGAQVLVNLSDTQPVLTAAFPVSTVYLAAGASDSWTLQLNTLQDGLPAGNVPVTWNAGAGLTLVAAPAASAAGGSATAVVHSGVVTGGEVSILIGCAWTNVCASWALQGVDPSTLQVAIMAGAGQSVRQGTALGAVQLLVTDAAGHAVQDAQITVHQRVLGWEGVCSPPGRCPAAPVLKVAQATMTSGADGTITLQPLSVAGVPQTVEIALSWGDGGFLTLTLVKTPA